MFDFVHNNKKVVHIFLGLIMLTFAFWGVQSYRSAGGDGVASVDGNSISPNEYDFAMRNEQERMRQSMGASFDPAIMDNPEFRLSVLDNVIEQKLLYNQAKNIGIRVSDRELVSFIQKIGAFQENGAFSQARYEALLKAQGMTPVVFEAKLKEDLYRQHLLEAVSRSGFVSKTEAGQILSILGEAREVSTMTLKPADFLAAQNIDAAAVKSYYDKHVDDFKVPEQVRVQYVVFSRDTLAASMEATEEEAKKYYEEHKDSEFSSKAERQASHILLTVAKGASPAEVDKVRAQAKKISAELKKSPEKFAEYAKQYSQDPGSAQHGGDLGFFGRGMMVKPFEDAVFAMKQGEISDPVQSDFGFHIIRLTAVKPVQVKSYQDAHEQVINDIKGQKAAKKFTEGAEDFGNKVYEQSESLKPAADAFKLEIRESGWMSKTAPDRAFPNNPKLMQAIFSPEVLQKKRNTEAVEVAPNTLVSARLAEMKPAYTRGLPEVSADIEKQLKLEAAQEKAKSEGEAKIKALQQGNASAVDFGATQSVTRQDSRTLAPEVARAVFMADKTKLPAYVGVNTADGYTLVKISKVTDAAPADAARVQAISGQLEQSLEREELNAYFKALKSRARISVNQAMLGKNQ